MTIRRPKKLNEEMSTANQYGTWKFDGLFGWCKLRALRARFVGRRALCEWFTERPHSRTHLTLARWSCSLLHANIATARQQDNKNTDNNIYRRKKNMANMDVGAENPLGCSLLAWRMNKFVMCFPQDV